MDTEDTIPVIVVTDELRNLVATMDFTAMSDDEFMDWLLERSTANIPKSLLGLE